MELTELVQFMQPSQRLDVKTIALDYVIGLTGTSEGRAVILSKEDVITALYNLVKDPAANIVKTTVFILINLAADADGAMKLLQTSKKVQPIFNIVHVAVDHILDQSSDFSDPWATVLSNLTRNEAIVHEVIDMLEQDPKTIPNLVKAFTQLDYNKKKAKLNDLGSIFCNLTQTLRGREIIVKSKHNLLDKLLPFVTYNDSLTRRGGCVGMLKNICFDENFHVFLDDENSELLTAILCPLCGSEVFTDEENDKFPIDLQYLPETKRREEDPDLRKMLLESLLQLCATKKRREQLRARGVYEILREYHKWEANIGKDMECLLACENVIDILIKTEEEIGLDNYKDVEVPSDLTEKFVADDAEYITNKDQ